MEVTVIKIAANIRYAMMKTQKYTIVMYSLFEPCGRLPRERTKHDTRVTR